MKWLVSIIREIEVDAMSLDEAKWRAIEIDGRPGEITHVQAERIKVPLTEAEVSPYG